MNRLSKETFGVARFFMAMAVFFCHVFEQFNSFGFLFVSVFFFMSGYGMESSKLRMKALVRLVPYILFFGWFSCIYFIFYYVSPYPSSWFFVVYFVVMVLYRLIPSFNGLLVSFLLLALFFILLGFQFGWCASYGAFLFGVFYAKHPSSFTLKSTLNFLPLIAFFFLRFELFAWGLLPLFCWIVLSLSSLKFFRPISCIGRYTFFFYCVHCFALGAFGVTWTLGGSPEFWGVLLAFSLSVFLSVFFKDYLFKYPKVS